MRDALQRGHPRVVVLYGSPGVGKSSLVNALASDEGAQVRCWRDSARDGQMSYNSRQSRQDFLRGREMEISTEKDVASKFRSFMLQTQHYKPLSLISSSKKTQTTARTTSASAQLIMMLELSCESRYDGSCIEPQLLEPS